MGICLGQGAGLHMSKLMPLPPTVSCFSEIQIGFTFLVLAYPGSAGQRAIKRVLLNLDFEQILVCQLIEWYEDVFRLNFSDVDLRAPKN